MPPGASPSTTAAGRFFSWFARAPMDGHQFDRLTQQFSRALSRRRFGAVLAALGLGLGAGAVAPPAETRKKKKKKKPKPCAAGTLRCGSACVDTQSNAQHCGGCGQSCPSGQACSGGQCQSGACPGSQIRCAGQCVNPNADETHCGTCGNACAGDLTCLSGQCGCASGTRCGTACVDLNEDDDHCGQCNQACNGDLACIGGQCGCESGTRCGNQCVNVNTSNAHCGACDDPCPGDLTCSGGQCGCASGTRCGNQCVNTQTSANHCGACDAPCDSGQTCAGGQCTAAIACTNDFQCYNSIAETGGTPTCVNGSCRCGGSGKGICTLPSGSRRCDVCCPGGSGACSTPDHVCRSFQTGVGLILTCDCPAGYRVCASNDYGYCSSDFATDQNRCGQNCLDCDRVNPGSACCAGICTRGNPPGNTPGAGYPCPGNGCQPCPFGTGCCNAGGTTAGGCVVLDALGRCPIPPP